MKDKLDDLWIAVCTNDIKFMQDYYSNGGVANKRYTKNNTKSSLIMGALRNKNFNMVELLKQNGETLLVGEVEEYKHLMTSSNYNDKTNINKIRDLLDKEQSLRKNNITLPPIESRLTADEREANIKWLDNFIKRYIKNEFKF